MDVDKQREANLDEIDFTAPEEADAPLAGGPPAVTTNAKPEDLDFSEELTQPRTRSRVPEWPGELCPSPSDLRRQYEQALADIYAARKTSQPEGKYPNAMRNAAFVAFQRALMGACGAAVCAAYPEGHWAEKHAPSIDVQVVASAPGSGKSTLAKAFAVGLARIDRQHPYPLGSVFLVHHIATADALYRELAALLPKDSVAVFSTKHDAARDDVIGGFKVDDLHKYPVLVITHEFYMGIRRERATEYTKGDLRLPRLVTFIDERVNEIAVYDMGPHGFEGVAEFIRRNTDGSSEMLQAIKALDKFIISQKYGKRGIVTPSHIREQWDQAVEATAELRTDDARRYARWAATQAPLLPFDQVFGFVDAMADDRAFITRDEAGQKGVRFVGYERALPRTAGMVLLDATADIDGVTKVVGWRRHAPTPSERYDNLEIHHTPSVATGSIRRWLAEGKNGAVYADHVRQLVLSHSEPGQRVLVVCVKQAVAAKGVPDWSEHMVPFLNRTPPAQAEQSDLATTEFAEGFAWPLEGRQVVFTWFGGYGIGANVWRDADTIIICDDFYLPQRSIKALLQGLNGHRATEGFLADTEARWSEELEYLQDGHILRWLKQMGLRGKARSMDTEGHCGHQTLVFTGDLIRLLAHRPVVFPGAKVIVDETGQGTMFERLLAILLNTKDPEISTRAVGDHLGVEWGDVSTNLRRAKGWNAALETIGWQYDKGSGRRLALFSKTNRSGL